MSSVDERVVNMKINNSQFLGGVKTTLAALQKLTAGLRGAGQNNGVDEIGNSAEQTKSKLGALNVAAMTVVGTITNKLVNAGLSMVKSLTLDPITQGFQEYQTNLNSIQTIMANTGKSVSTVNKYLGDLNHYSDQTIYNFSQMADSIGKFTAAGVKLPQATVAIKGMANTAALSGANAMQLNSAMYQMSQALAAGSIKLMDWNSLVNANMGGKNVQNALKATAMAMGEEGKVMEDAIKKHGNFRESLTEGWLTSDVFTKAMDVMAGTTDKATGKTVAYSEAQLKAKGYTAAQAKELHRVSQASIDAATQIKTLPQMIDVIKESVGSQFSQIFTDIMGNFNQSKRLWTSVGTAITDKISEVGNHWDRLLKNWGKMGGRRDLINGFRNVAQPILAIFKAIGTAWEEVFPPATAKSLKDLTQGFEDFTKKLFIGYQSAYKIKDVFAGLFSLLHAGATIVGIIFHAIFGFFGLFSGGASGGILSIAAALGQLFTKFDKFVSEGAAPKANSALSSFFAKLGGVKGMVSKAADAIGNALQSIKDKLSAFFGGMDGGNWSTVFGAVLTGALSGGIFVAVKKLMGVLNKLRDDAGGMMESISGIFGTLGDSLKTMQNNVKSKTLMNIAISVGILAASLLVLSNIKPEKLAIGIGAIATLMAELVGALQGLAMVSKTVKLPLLAASLIMLSSAIVILAGAVAAFGMMDPKTLAQGLAGVGATIIELVAAAALMGKFGKSFIFAATSLTILSVALGLLAGVIALYSKFDLKTMAKGLGGVAATLVVIGLAMRAMPNGAMMILQGAALVIVAGAIAALTASLKILGGMSLEELGKGLGALAIGLTLIAAALLVMNGAIVGAAALIIAAGAITAIALALKVLGDMSIASLATALGALAVALALLIGAGMAADLAAPGLIALGAAIALIGIGVGAIIISIAAFVAALAALVAALALLQGVGVAAFAVLIQGIKMFLAILPDIAIAGAGALVALVVEIGRQAPKIINAFVKIVGAMLDGANRLLPKFMIFINNLVGGLIRVITVNIPKIGHMFGVLIDTGLMILRTRIPKIINTGIALIMAFLSAIDRNIPRMADKAGSIIVHFIQGIDRNLSRIVTAGTNLVIHFIQGVGNNAVKLANAAAKVIVQTLQGINQAIRTYGPQIRSAGEEIGWSIAAGMTGGLSDKAREVAGKASELAHGALSAIHDAIKNPPYPSREGMKLGRSLGTGFRVGIESTHRATAKAAGHLGHKAVHAAKKVVDPISKMFDGLGIGVGKGFVRGIQNSLNTVKSAGQQMAKDTIDTVTKTTTMLQLRADAQMAKAEAYRDMAAILRQKAKNKKLSKSQKKHLEDQAKGLDGHAKTAQKAAERTQKSVDAINRRADAARAYREADDQGKADILNKRSEDAAKAAEKNREQALKLAHEADLIRKQDAKRAKELDKQAQQALANSKRAAQDAKSNAQKAAEFATKIVLASSSGVAKDLNDWLAQEEADKAYAAMTTEQQKAEMEKRSTADQKRSDALIASARDKLAKADKLAKTNAKAAQDLVEAAAADVEAAKSYRDKAEQEAENAKQLMGQAGSSDSSSSIDNLKMPDMTIASSMVYGAQNMFDAYTKALAATSSAASGDQAPGITFVQNNTSPVALSPSEIYRQSKNLLSNAERKLTGALT